MSKTQFNVRIDEETNRLIVAYTEYISIKNGFTVNPGDVNRATIKKGIETLINQEGGLKHIQDVINDNFNDDIENGLLIPFESEDEIKDLTQDEKDKRIKAQIEAGEKYNNKYLNYLKEEK